MKYWWLEKYRHLKLILLPELISDLKMFVVMPKNYENIYQELKEIEISLLREEELLIVLYSSAIHKKLKNGELISVIDRLLMVPDNSLPISDYSLEEMLREISKLKKCIPFQEKLEKNNIAACYSCIQVFYLDQIHYVDKKGVCLCPYCSNKTLYFDNDYIPMDFYFLKLAQLYYGTSSLGCKWKHLQKLLKKSICLEEQSTELFFSTHNGENSFNRDKGVFLQRSRVVLLKKVPTSREEMELWSSYYLGFLFLEKEMIQSVTIELEEVPVPWREPYLLSLLTLILEFLGRNPYLKKICFRFPNEETKEILERQILTFYKIK